MTMDQGSSGSGDTLQQTAGDVASRATDLAHQQIEAQVEPQLDRVADMLKQLAGAVRQAGDQVRQDQPQVASITDAAAGQVEKASSFFRENDMTGVVREIEDVARRQPVLFVGAAVAVGAFAARFLKASPSSGYAGSRAGFDREYRRYGYGSSDAYGYDRSYGGYGGGRSGVGYDAGRDDVDRGGAGYRSATGDAYTRASSEVDESGRPYGEPSGGTPDGGI